MSEHPNYTIMIFSSAVIGAAVASVVVVLSRMAGVL